jgi:uncharacterized damage-inducible protein DinB
MTSLASVYDGWGGYQTSLVGAVAPLSPEHLVWRPAAHRRSVGEIVRHIALGRVTWFARMGAPGTAEIVAKVPAWATDDDGAGHAVEDAVPADDPEGLRAWLEVSWRPVLHVLDEWTVADLATTYRHRWQGRDYAVSRQWTIWRIMAHDIHHGGQLAMMLGILGVDAFELRQLGGHVVLPDLAAPGTEG